MGTRWLVESSSPDISVVVPTVPANDLQSAEPLRSQRDVDYEVVVVSNDDLDICEARDRGIRAASADLVALTDDDTRPPSTWLRTTYEAVAEPGIHLVEGPVGGEDLFRRVYPGCNVAFTRTAWERVGGFDSRYAGWMEDVVFGWEVERTFGLDATDHVPAMEIEHLGPMRSAPIEHNERLARREYRQRYFRVMRQPNSLSGKLLVGLAGRTYPLAPRLWDTVFAKRRE